MKVREIAAQDIPNNKARVIHVTYSSKFKNPNKLYVLSNKQMSNYVSVMYTHIMQKHLHKWIHQISTDEKPDIVKNFLQKNNV